jgi:hypothetical protein
MNMTKTRFFIQPQLPRAGLGNMLLVWARAVLFAELNSLPVLAPNWQQFRIGPYLRGERDRRDYWFLFHRRNYLSIWNETFATCSMPERHYNPHPISIDLSAFQKDRLNHLFIFNSVPHWSDYFEYLRDFQPLIQQKLLGDIRSSVLKKIEKLPRPQIGIHLRMSDFKIIQNREEFSKLGSVRTPIDWFIQVLNCIRSQVGYDVPATIFSDGHDHELEDLLRLPAIYRPPSNHALSDLLTLSKSRVLIASSGSTFSGWASYLGQCPTIWHPAHFHAGVFPTSLTEKVFEGGFDPTSMAIPDLLLRNVQEISYSNHT